VLIWRGARLIETYSRLLWGGSVFAGVLQKDVRFLNEPVPGVGCCDSRISQCLIWTGMEVRLRTVIMENAMAIVRNISLRIRKRGRLSRTLITINIRNRSAPDISRNIVYLLGTGQTFADLILIICSRSKIK